MGTGTAASQQAVEGSELALHEYNQRVHCLLDSDVQLWRVYIKYA